MIGKYFFKGYKNAVFVDIIAHDGKKFNNTMYYNDNCNKIIKYLEIKV